MRLFLLAFLTLAAALSAPAPAAAQFLELEVRTVAYRELPADTPIRVRSEAESELDDRARRAVEEALLERQYRITDDAPLVLSIEAVTSGGGAEDPLLGTYSATQNEVEVLFNVWSSQQDGLLRRRDRAVPSEALYRIDVSIYDNRGGRYIWRGTVSTTTNPASVYQATVPMVERLMESFGKTDGPEEAAQ